MAGAASVDDLYRGRFRMAAVILFHYFLQDGTCHRLFEMNGTRRLPLFGESVGLKSLVAIALSLAFMSLVGATAGLQTPLPAAVLAMLFYLLPAGVGLVVLPNPGTMSRLGLRKSEHALLAYFVGLILITLTVVARERNSSLGIRASLFDPLVLDYVLLVVGAWGWIRTLYQWRDFRGVADFVRVAFWCSPLFVVPYTLTFFVFSRYPLTDLFQFTHIMKGAEEFAGFDRINPFTADSYAAVIQPVLGSLLRLTGANSLDAVWLLPLPAYLLRAAALYAVGRRLLRDHRGVIVLVAISLPFFGTGVLTNGDLAALGCLLVMATMLGTLEKFSASAVITWGVAFGITAALVVSLAFARFLPDWVLLCLVILGALAIRLASHRTGILVPFMTLCLATTAIAPLHRSTVLLVPAITFSVAWVRKPLLNRYRLQCFSAGLAFVGIVLVAGVLLNEYAYFSFPDPGKALTRWIDVVFEANFSTSQDAMFGTGSKVALFEIARSVGPLVALWSLLLAVRCLSGKADEKNGGVAAIRSDAAWTAGCALVVLLLFGLPFAYRAVFVPVILFAALIARHVVDLSDHALIHATAGLLAITLLIAVAEYALPEVSSAAVYYIDRAMPALLLCLVPIVAVGTALVLRPRWARAGLVLLVVWVVLFEKQVIRYHFFHYSFPGEPPPRSEPLSHYTLHDVRVANWIRENYGDGILISDPYTLAITRALTGLNSVVTFSNLDTMNARAADELRQYLQSILRAGEAPSGGQNCGEWNRAARLLSFGVSSESNYALFQMNNPELFGRDVLKVFGYRSGLLLSSPDAAKDVPIVENRHAWLADKHLAGSALNTTKAVPRSEREMRAITIINGRTIEWAFGLFAVQRHGGDGWDPGLALHDAVVKQCQAAEGPGDSLILAHPLGNK